jgi:hypothetical protein
MWINPLVLYAYVNKPISTIRLCRITIPKEFFLNIYIFLFFWLQSDKIRFNSMDVDALKKQQ